MAHPLRRVIFGTAILMVVLLGGLLTLGIRQYQLLGHHEQIIAQSEKLLFQFANIREHITSSLLEQRHQQLPAIVPEVEALQTNINQIVQNAHIPDEYKLSFINQIDLPGIILLLYKGGSDQAPGEFTQELNRETRQLGERLMLFDRLLVNYAKRKVIAFQSLVIGILALSVFLMVNMLVIGHRRLATPLIELASQVREVHQGQRDAVTLASRSTSGEVTELALAFQDLLASRLENLSALARHNRVLYAVHRASMACRQAPSRDALFQEVSRALLFNEDYFLVWVGIQDKDSGEVTPLVVDGSPTMSRDESEKSMAALLAATDEKGADQNPATQAVLSGKAVISRDMLAGFPRGMLKGTPLIDGYAACAALPLQWRKNVYGLLSVYTICEDCFDDKEIELLSGLAGAMGLALHIFEEEKRHSFEEERVRGLLAAMET
ncbi:MAG: GAF domain-containing protein, partial [Desulfobulbaceae bacterium]|nr:GAF domain-containing protein [Desulfobulbaceae bacterium]